MRRPLQDVLSAAPVRVLERLWSRVGVNANRDRGDGSQAPSMLALTPFWEISPQKAGHGCHGYPQTADGVGQLRNVAQRCCGGVCKERSLIYVNNNNRFTKQFMSLSGSKLFLK